jgi:hypothetical protein
MMNDELKLGYGNKPKSQFEEAFLRKKLKQP